MEVAILFGMVIGFEDERLEDAIERLEPVDTFDS